MSGKNVSWCYQQLHQANDTSLWLKSSRHIFCVATRWLFFFSFSRKKNIREMNWNWCKLALLNLLPSKRTLEFNFHFPNANKGRIIGETVITKEFKSIFERLKRFSTPPRTPHFYCLSNKFIQMLWRIKTLYSVPTMALGLQNN